MVLNNSEKIISMSIMKSKYGNDCLIYITDNKLKIIRLKKEDEFLIRKINLEFSARKMYLNRDTLKLIITQSQCRTISNL